MSKLTFLGTGGGRFVILSQRRYSGGLWLETKDGQVIIDPGPGSLIRARQFGKKPEKLSAILVSHHHLDHYADTEVMIEAMTGGAKKKRGILVTTRETLDYVSSYHQQVVEVKTPKAGDTFCLGKTKVEALPTIQHANALGFKFFTSEGTLTYSSDTAFFPELSAAYRGSTLLVLNVIFPGDRPISTHLNTSTAEKIIEAAQPQRAVITHFGRQMLNANPEKEAQMIEEKTGIRTIAARDGMVLDLKDKEDQSRLFRF